MKFVRCDHCGEEFNPFSDGGMTLTLSTINGSISLDFCPKHGLALYRSIDKYVGYILTKNEEDMNIEDNTEEE